MDPFEKVIRQLLDNLETRLNEARTQADQRRYEIVWDIMKDLKRISDNVIAEELAGASGYEVMWEQIKVATTSQVHAFATDLKINRGLTHQTIVEMASRGSMTFLESAMGLMSGHTLDKIKDILTLRDVPAFVALMKKADVPDDLAPKYLGLIKAHNKKKK